MVLGICKIVVYADDDEDAHDAIDEMLTVVHVHVYVYVYACMAGRERE